MWFPRAREGCIPGAKRRRREISLSSTTCWPARRTGIGQSFTAGVTRIVSGTEAADDAAGMRDVDRGDPLDVARAPHWGGDSPVEARSHGAAVCLFAEFASGPALASL